MFKLAFVLPYTYRLRERILKTGVSWKNFGKFNPRHRHHLRSSNSRRHRRHRSNSRRPHSTLGRKQTPQRPQGRRRERQARRRCQAGYRPNPEARTQCPRARR